MIMGGTRYDYVEVVIEACTGDTHVITFKGLNFTTSKVQANRAAGMLSVIGMGGQSLGHYREHDQGEWFSHFPNWAHLTRVTVNNRMESSDELFLHTQRVYNCSHTRQVEQFV